MRVLASCALSAALIASPALASPFKGTHCQVKVPPPEAGDDLSHGGVVKVFPRRSALARDYSGCQSTWTSDKGQWTLLGTAHFVKGEGVALWMPPPNETTCRYAGGKAASPNCPPPAGLKVRSMPPGCTQKILGRGGNAGCDYD